MLNGTGSGLVNNVCVPSDVSPAYAPPGQALISVSLLGMPEPADLEAQVLEELEAWFGSDVRKWRHLRTVRIERALPEQESGVGLVGPGYRKHLRHSDLRGSSLERVDRGRDHLRTADGGRDPALIVNHEASPMNGVKKHNLPEKICLQCQRPFAWRKKWARLAECSLLQ